MPTTAWIPNRSQAATSSSTSGPGTSTALASSRSQKSFQPLNELAPAAHLFDG
jgi:hypothetical protein